jgi:hypothetical protein
VAAAVLSFTAAERALARTAAESLSQRTHQRDLTVWDRRLRAIETVWWHTYEIERLNRLTNKAREQLVVASVWLPSAAGEAVLGLLDQLQAEPSADCSAVVNGVRSSLLRAIEASLTRLEEERR